MKRNLSITTAAAALLIGTVFAAAQGVQRPGGAEQGGAQGQGTQMPQPDTGKGKAQSKEPRTQGQGGQAQTAPEPKAKEKAKEQRTQGQGGQAQTEPKATEPKTKEKAKEPRTQGQAPQQQQQQTQQPQQTQPKQPSQTQQQPSPGDRAPGTTQKGAETKGGAESGGVTLTTEQRSTIRTTVLQSSNAPRVSNVNFSVSVGTVVPRTVTLVEVPPTLVQIHPAWRGYRYFIVGERIIIVEPSSLKIVAVLVV